MSNTIIPDSADEYSGFYLYYVGGSATEAAPRNPWVIGAVYNSGGTVGDYARFSNKADAVAFAEMDCPP